MWSSTYAKAVQTKMKFTQQNLAYTYTTEFHPVQGETEKHGYAAYSISGNSNIKSL